MPCHTYTKLEPCKPCTYPCHVQDCAGGQCLPHHLNKAMHHCGGKVHAHTSAPAQTKQSASTGLQGSLELPGLDQKLDMALPGVKLFALELAALQGASQQLLDKAKQHSAAELDKVGRAATWGTGEATFELRGHYTIGSY